MHGKETKVLFTFLIAISQSELFIVDFKDVKAIFLSTDSAGVSCMSRTCGHLWHVLFWKVLLDGTWCSEGCRLDLLCQHGPTTWSYHIHLYAQCQGWCGGWSYCGEYWYTFSSFNLLCFSCPHPHHSLLLVLFLSSSSSSELLVLFFSLNVLPFL